MKIVSQAFTYSYFFTEYTAPVVMGLALWRSRVVPRWLAVLFTAGLETAEAQSARGLIVIWFMLPFAAAMVLLAARIWQAATAPASHVTEPAGGPRIHGRARYSTPPAQEREPS